MAPPNDKKRHHYVPIAYLSPFAGQRGQLWIYEKDKDRAPFRSRPSQIAFENYYYSQPLTGGGQDNNTLEDLFSTIETDWTPLVKLLADQAPIGDRAAALFNFVGLLRVRVPAIRDAIELQLAQSVRTTYHILDRAGQLPPLPAGITFDQVNVLIDPHRSLLAMEPLLKGVAQLYERIGFEVLHNQTDVDFITSDNPVVYFDPDLPDASLRPYTVPPGRRIELLLPLTPRLLLRGTTELPIFRPGDDFRHADLTDRDGVDRVNRLVARFGYRFVFAGAAGLDQLVSEFADQSPILTFGSLPAPRGLVQTSRFEFGRRPAKPRWRAQTEE